ncbi:MAG: hypothetical protein LC745_00175, partial [Planctomycetia bacterium]|nr:hypothetical protein [Planctomycetia bacterium]
KDPVCPPLTHAGPIRELRFVEELNLLVTASDDSVKIWDGLTGVLKKEIQGQTARPLFFTGDWGSKRFVTVAKGGRGVTTWDLTTFEPVGTLAAPEGTPRWIGAGLSGDGKTLATVGEDRALTLYDQATRQPYATLRPPSRLLVRVFPDTTLGSDKPALQLDDAFWRSVVPLEPETTAGDGAKKAD